MINLVRSPGIGFGFFLSVKWIVALLGWVTLTSVSFSHPFHLCVGQMKWNESSKRWEVSLRLHPQDLELAMHLDHAKANPSDPKKFSTEDTDFPEHAIEYINQHLFLRRSPTAMTQKELQAVLNAEASSASKSEETRSLRSASTWVGMEQERGWLWIHLELEQPQILANEKLWMNNSLLLDHVARQENTMSVDPGTQAKFSMQFKKDEFLREMVGLP